MRITTQMLNETARKSGLPITCNTLLNQINGGNTGNSLLNALNHKNSKNSVFQDVEKTNHYGYEKLEKTTDKLLRQVEKFTAKDKDSIFDKVSEDGDNQELYTGVECLVKHYNSTLEALQSASGTLNSYYYQMLREAATENKEALSDIGITVSKKGALELDKDKLKNADIKSIKEVLGSSGTFSTKTEFLATRILDNAEANRNMTSNQYNATGNIYSARLNRYDVWG